MSDQDTQDKETPEAAPAPATAEDKPEAAPAKPTEALKPAEPAKKGSSAIAWLALLLVIALAFGVALLVREGQHREEVLAQRMTALARMERPPEKSSWETLPSTMRMLSFTSNSRCSL